MNFMSSRHQGVWLGHRRHPHFHYRRDLDRPRFDRQRSATDYCEGVDRRRDTAPSRTDRHHDNNL